MPASPSVAALENQLIRVLPPLYQRTRKPAVTSLAQRLQSQLAQRNTESGALVLPLVDTLNRIHQEVTQTEAELATLLRRYAQAPDEATRRALLVRWLEETVKDPSALKGDLAALDRWLGIDTLRERLDRKRQLLLVEEEMALRCVAGLLRARRSLQAPRERLRHLTLVLLDRALGSPRLMTQLAGTAAVRELLLSAPAALEAVPDTALALQSVLEQPEAHPFAQAEALEALLLADGARGLAQLRERLERPQEGERDFLFRRHALELCVPHLPEEEQLALLGHALRSDPSEHVRLGACELLVGEGRRLTLLGEAAGLATPREPSHKVRAGAVLALARSAASHPATLPEVSSLLARVLAQEDAELVLRMGAEQCAALAETLPPETLAARAPALIAALANLRAREEVRGAALEAAAAAEQTVRRAVDPARRAWTEHLAKAAQGIAAGGRTRLKVDPPPEGLPPLPEDPAFLGAILADLSARDLGLYGELRRGQLVLWRGDRFTRRLWRLWHELRRPAPNKRQAFPHTVGRQVPGTLRAHPARMDEVTETRVPGERVHVPSEGGWGRHLPTVDDLLELPVGSDEPLQVFSSHGITTVRPPRSSWERLRNRLRLSFGYRDFAQTRLASLSGQEPRERRRYVEKVRQELGVELEFQPYQPGESAPAPLRTLFDTGGGRLNAVLPLALVSTAEFFVQLRERLFENESYFLGISGNGLGALALFTAGLFTLFLWSAFSRREAVRRARASVPLCIGGWGTRGKSGTERLKAALLGGMGFDVFAKTTGSEAMFVHSAPGAPPVEFFIYRPYDKATIWEQSDMVALGSRLGVEVFLWECMALQPSFVELLQNDWMRDDYATLTNAYPDHEDIQGPAGQNVAQVITNFMPNGRTVVTTEDHFLPLFQDAARQRGARLLHSPWWEAELISDELLELFPYREHPRNMALVATLGEQLGVSRSFAMGLMSEFVQPEIGVLKVFPEARLRGRTLQFINGHSANERTGFLNNWTRTGLDKVSPETDPDRSVLTVVNNRWDRVSRSEVFARILVEDANADRHVLIGTNLVGLQKYVREALDAYLARTELVSEEDLGTEEGRARAAARLSRQLARLKVPRPSVDTFIDRLRRYASGAERALTVSPDLRAELATLLRGEGGELDVSTVRAALDTQFGKQLEAALSEGCPSHPLPEVLEPASTAEVRQHALYLLARLVVHARLLRALPTAAEELASFHAAFRQAYRELFLEQLVVVEDPLATGDQVVDACARAAAPGMRVSIIGAQNIKGTGLDWVYRWLALDKVQQAVRTLQRARAPQARGRALETLESFTDHGLLDSGLLRATLPELAAQANDPQETERLTQLAKSAAEQHAQKVAALRAVRAGSLKERAVQALEKTFDYLDGVHRRRISDALIEDLVAGRVSHARAALETRRLYERQKGGWLRLEAEETLRGLRGWFTRRPRAPKLPELEPLLPSAEPAPLLRSEFLRALTAREDLPVQVPLQQSANTLAEAPPAVFGEDEKPQA